MKGYDNTGKAIDAVLNATKTALMAAATDVHGQAVELAPVDTGNLKGSLSWTVGGEVGGLNSGGGKASKGAPKRATPDQGVHKTDATDTAYIGTNIEYSMWLEYGTSKMAAQAYLRPALDAREKYVPEIMKKHYQKALRGVVK